MGNCKPEPATFDTNLRPQVGVKRLRPATEKQKPATAGFCFKIKIV